MHEGEIAWQQEIGNSFVHHTPGLHCHDLIGTYMYLQSLRLLYNFKVDPVQFLITLKNWHTSRVCVGLVQYFEIVV